MKISKVFNVIGEVSDTAVGMFGTVGTAVNAGKEALEATVSQYQKESEIEDAKTRILVKAKAIKDIAKELGISYEKAEELLDSELNGD